MKDIILELASQLKVREKQIEDTVALIDAGNTIPFIARYRKEVTGGLDDAQLRDLYDRLTYLRSMKDRREEIIRLIEEQGRLDHDLIVKINNAKTMTELEDIYRPFRPKRRTRATMAKEKGLKPLADIVFAQELIDGDILHIATSYINLEKEVHSPEEALQGAMDIVAENLADDADLRKAIREYTFRHGLLVTKGTSDQKSVYEMYYEYREAVKQIVPHRILAINRGEKEGFLKVKIELDQQEVTDLIENMVIKNRESIVLPYMKEVILDSYKRLMALSIEREIRNQLTERAEEQAIKIFGENLGNLLLQPPIKGKIVMGIDPGYRTGNKIAVVDDTGKVLDTGLVYMTLPHHDMDKAKDYLGALIDKHQVEIIAIGNGTGSKETEILVADLIKERNGKVYYVIVNEAGASVYSASSLGSEEFPEFDVALRSAVSIARRLQDPLSELVKIDPKAIGVGQYQHDVNQKRLSDTLQGVVEDCVNSVGVDLNTASSSLLQYVAGISKTVSQNIVAYREEIGKFSSRKELLKVKGLGPKTFEQCAGFLRIPGAANLLDNTAVHPESYDATAELLDLNGYSLKDLSPVRINELQKTIEGWDLEELARSSGIGIPTLSDILEELKKPGRDPREELPQPILRSDIMDIQDLKAEMILTGTVRNVVDFGAFVDIGVHQDGLVHISQLASSYVRHPMDVVQVGDIVKVKVLEVDLERSRISLTMRDL
ncbi:MAG: RNA-binding transcriptional accessory protein [Clostridiales bacterium]|nr:RNA-binding transcriptional accessory protein [Clostridiales bacterium]